LTVEYNLRDTKNFYSVRGGGGRIVLPQWPG